MFGRKPKLEEGTPVFSVKQNGEFKDFIFGIVTGVEGRRVGVNGVIVNPVGLKNKITQGKTGERSREVLENPNPDNVVLALVYRIEHENYATELNLDEDKCDIIPPKSMQCLMVGFVNHCQNSLTQFYHYLKVQKETRQNEF